VLPVANHVEYVGLNLLKTFIQLFIYNKSRTHGAQIWDRQALLFCALDSDDFFLLIIFYSLIYLLKKRGRQAERRQTDVVASLWCVAIG